ncbi:MAG: hypothetical protein ABIH23_29910, partial [bacterium]
EHSRWIGDANPYSLFLAAGVPFEVVEQPASSGWTFLSDWDAKAAASHQLQSENTAFVYRLSAGVELSGGNAIPETMEGLFAFKRTIVPHLKEIPYVEEDVPVVCAWYPSARSVLLWNVTEQRQEVTLRYKDTRQTRGLAALDSMLVRDLS